MHGETRYNSNLFMQYSNGFEDDSVPSVAQLLVPLDVNAPSASALFSISVDFCILIPEGQVFSKYESTDC